MHKFKRAPQRPLGFETLESRLPLAGNIVLKVSGGNLTVTGDAAASDISIVQTGAGNFTVTGNNLETFKVKGSPDTQDPVLLTGVTKNISVNMKGGDDSFTLTGMGIANALAKNVTIKTGAGHDDVFVSAGKLNGKLSINMGKGLSDADGVSLHDVDVALSTTVNTGKVTDTVFIANSNFGANLSIDAGTCFGALSDDVNLNVVTVTGNLKITTRGGFDIIDVKTTIAKKATISTGIGDDTVNVDAVTVNRALVNMGAGGDTLTVGAGALTLLGPAKTKVTGGSGTDAIHGAANLSAGSLAHLVDPTKTGVESIVA